MRALFASAVLACSLAALPAHAQKTGVCHETGTTVQGTEASLPEALAAALEAARAEHKFHLDPNDVLWCAGSDDPRCQPVSDTRGPDPLTKLPTAYFPVPASLPRCTTAACVFPRETSDLARDGFCVPLDRPPQA